MKAFISPQWQTLLQENGFHHLEDFWQLPKEWVEPPNYRRGGWSGVTRWILKNTMGESYVIYIKRQLNHTHRGLRHPFKGEPTAQREFRGIQRCRKKNIPVLEPIFFQKKKSKEGLQTVLVTAELKGYQSIESWMAYWQSTHFPSRIQRLFIIKNIAQAVAQLHYHGFQHGCLHDKHIFMQWNNDHHIDIAFIDLEMLKWLPHRAALRDIYALDQYSPGWNRKERLAFIKYYWGDTYALSSTAKKFWRKLQQRHKDKQRRKMQRAKKC
ncbi:MAG: lipopolysaccharide kinase InaA family protein [Gammaproteobacteria bacterium]